MTVAAEIPLALYDGDGVTVAFPAPWRYLTTAHLLVELIASDGTASPRALGTHYAATAGATDAGGTVTMVTPPAVGQTLRIRRVTPLAQQTAYPTSGNFPAKSHELALDRLTLIAQEQAGDIDDVQARALQVPFGEVAPPFPPIAERAGKYIAFDAAGLPVAATGMGGDSGLRADMAMPTGTGLLGWIQSGLGAVLRSLAAKLFEMPISPRDFDLTAGTGNATNDTAAINRALAESGATRRPVIIDRPYKINGTLVRPTGSEIFGTTMAVPLLVLQAGNYDLFQFVGSWTKTKNLQIDASLRTSGYDINFDLAAGGGSQVEHRFKDLFITGSTGGIKDTYVSGGYVVYRVYANNVKWAQHRGHGIRLTRGFGFLYFDMECLVEYIGSSSPNWTGVYYDGAGLGAGAGGLHLGISVAGTATVGATNANQIGFDIRNAAAVFLTERARAENMGGCAGIFTAINGLDFGPKFGAYHCNDDQVRIVACTQVSGSIEAIGRVGIGTPAAGKHAIKVTGSDNLEMITLAGKSCTGNGVDISTSNVVDIAQIIGKLNDGRGWVTDANGVVGAKSGVFAANAGGNYNQGGALHTLRNVTLQSGTCVDVDGVAIG